MSEEQKRKAEHLALENLERWAEVSGYIPEGTSVYFEVECLIKDAVDIGAKMALDQPVNLEDYINNSYL